MSKANPGRQGGSGRFVEITTGTRSPKTSATERVPIPGRGDGGATEVYRDSKSGRFLDQKPVTKRGNISNSDAIRAVEDYWPGKK